jgi:polysaccharide export outer membrane protein
MRKKPHNVLLAAKILLLMMVFTLGGCATSNVPKEKAAEEVHSETILLREGDTLKISFPGSPNLDTTQEIRRDGKISLPLIGEVDAAGKSPDELQQSLIKSYAPQISSKEVNVEVESSSFPVYVTGCVMRPGKILSDQPITAIEAVMEAGGFDYTKANLKAVRVIRHENGAAQSYTLNLKLVLDGKDKKLFYLKPSDIIYVPEKFELF